MRLTLHIVRKDLVRMRLPMALWALTFAWQFALGIRLLHGDTQDLNAFARIQLYDWLAFGIQVAVSFVLVATLIHEDPLVGSSAFWPTRPISGVQLLGAKLIGFLAIFGVFPILVTLPWWLYCGYGLHDVWWAALHTFCVSLLAPLVALMVASLTGNMSRFLASSILLLAFLVITFTTFSLADPVFNRPKTPFRPQDVESGFRFLMDLGLVGFPLVAAHQYLTRRTIRSLVLLGGLLGCMIFVESRNPFVPHFYDLIHGPSLPTPSYPRNQSIHFDFKEAYIGNYPAPLGDPVLAQEVFRVEGLPANTALQLDNQGNSEEWIWPDGTRYVTNAIWQRWGAGGPPPLLPHKPDPRARERWEWNNAHGKFHVDKTYEDMLRRINGPRMLDGSWLINVLVPPEVISKLHTSAPSCAITLKGSLIQWDLRPDFGLNAGAGWERDAEGLHIGRAAWDPKIKAFEVIMIEHHPAWGALIEMDTHTIPTAAPTIINRGLGEFARWVNGGNVEATRIGTVMIAWTQAWWRGPQKWIGEDKWEANLSPDWFSGATVGGLVKRRVETFEGKLVVGAFALTEPPAPDPEPQNY